MKENSPLLSVKVPHCVVECALLFSDAQQASLTTSFIQQALDRDRQCVFSGVMPSCSNALVATWIFPPFMGYKASAQHFEPAFMLIFFAY